MNTVRLIYSIVATPIGDLLLTAESGGTALLGVSMESHKEGPEWSRIAGCPRDDHHAALAPARAQLFAYFDGERRDFDLELDFRGTEFQRRVWNALLAIPFGETITYAELARRVGAPGAARAAGAAVGRNPLPIIAPCHRVVGSDGSLTGFGGGLDRKRWLLEHEGVGATGTLFRETARAGLVI